MVVETHNVPGEPVFIISVMAANWFCEKCQLKWESGGCETGVLNNNNKT